MVNHIDIDENLLLHQYPNVLPKLLLDRTTGNNLLWATEDYEHLGPGYLQREEITVPSITRSNSGVIKPRVLKNRLEQTSRTKDKAEVFTPSWVCNQQNNAVDEAWFGRPGVFNIERENGWISTSEPVAFPDSAGRTWKHYVDERRIEITCGEAPYLVSRYDSTTGKAIPVEERIGLLDRKLRVVSENCDSEQDYLDWAFRAFESTYGFEYQGDSLLLARENVLFTFIDNVRLRLGRDPSPRELDKIALIVSWNLWQMDAYTSQPPFSISVNSAWMLDLGMEPPLASKKCVVRDWRAKKTLAFEQLIQN